MRFAPVGLRPLLPEMRAEGPVRPVRHYGSVDVFLEAINRSAPGEVLVIDNGGRTDEACIGDMIGLEARAGGLAGLLVWGLHRDTAELGAIKLPVFSCGTCPAGPQRLDPREPEAFTSARFGSLLVTADDHAFADADGALFAPRGRRDEILAVAREISTTERRQADAIRAGRLLRDQLRVSDYVQKRSANPSLTFRQHLREIRGAVEE